MKSQQQPCNICREALNCFHNEGQIDKPIFYTLRTTREYHWYPQGRVHRLFHTSKISLQVTHFL